MKETVILLLLLMTFSNLVAWDDVSTSGENNVQVSYDDFCWIVGKNDTIFSLIDGKRFLYLGFGKNHFITIDEGDHYTIFEGNDSSGLFQIDKVGNVISSSSIVKWGMDSIATEAQQEDSINQVENQWMQGRIMLISEDKEILFDCDNIFECNKKDCVTFNRKLSELCALYFYLSIPKDQRGKIFDKEFHNKYSSIISN